MFRVFKAANFKPVSAYWAPVTEKRAKETVTDHGGLVLSQSGDEGDPGDVGIAGHMRFTDPSTKKFSILWVKCLSTRDRNCLRLTETRASLDVHAPVSGVISDLVDGVDNVVKGDPGLSGGKH